MLKWIMRLEVEQEEYGEIITELIYLWINKSKNHILEKQEGNMGMHYGKLYEYGKIRR